MSRRRGASIVTSRPPIRMRPDVTSSRPASMRRSVVFPQPDGPTRTRNSPSAISRSTASTARTPFAYTFTSCSSSMFATIRRLRSFGSRVDHEQALLRHVTDPVPDSFPAVAGQLLAAVRHVVDAKRVRVVHDHSTHFQPVDRTLDDADIVREDPRLEAVRRIVCEADGFVDVVVRLENDDRGDRLRGTGA